MSPNARQEAPRSPWNSLEIARLLMAAATPLALFGLGILVSQQAVVCDQCSTLSGDRHACVYACPHEAAMRIDAWIDLPQA